MTVPVRSPAGTPSGPVAGELQVIMNSPGGQPAVLPDARLALASSGLTKQFRGGQLAVDGIDLAVPAGSVYGFLGPNGSGKTTTIRMLLGLIEPTSGSHEVLGEPMPDGLAAALPLVGSLVEGPAFYPYLSGRANLARLDAADRTASPATARVRIDEALDRVGLLAAADKRYRAYSLGMKQRLAIATSLLRPRELVILDEPTNGLDPQGTREVRVADPADRRRRRHGLRFLAPAGRGRAGMHPPRRHARRTAGLPGPAGRTARHRRGAVAGPHAAAGTRRPSCWPDWAWPTITAGGNEVSAELGSLLPEVVCDKLVYAGVPVAGLETPRRSLEDEFVELTGEGFDVG